MKFIQIVIVIMIFVTSLEAKWKCSSKIDKMDSIQIDTCLTSNIDGYKSLRGAPVLLIKTAGEQFDIYFSIGEYVGGIEEIEVKFGNSPKELYDVGVSTDNTALFIYDTSAFIEKMFKNDTLIIRYLPLNGSTTTLEFDIRGFKSKDSTKLFSSINRIISAKETFMLKVIDMKNNGNLNAASCENIGGEWVWYGTNNEWMCYKR